MKGLPGSLLTRGPCLTLASTLASLLLVLSASPLFHVEHSVSVHVDTRDWGCRDLRLRGPSVRFAGLASRPVSRYQPGRDFASIAFWGNFPNSEASKYVLLRIAFPRYGVVLCKCNLNNINHTMNNQITFGASHSLKTKTVRFSYGTCKEAALQIPAEPASLFQVARLIRESYLAYMFSKPVLMSDDCLLSCIGRSNFEAGALGGWQSRLGAEAFASLKNLVEDNVAMALAIIRRRNPDIEGKEAYFRAAQIEGLSHFDKVCLESIAEAKA